MLTADASPIVDDDGLPSVFDYQWSRVDADGTSNETEITGETAATYTLATADVGKKIKVKVSFTDDLSSDGRAHQRGDGDGDGRHHPCVWWAGEQPQPGRVR